MTLKLNTTELTTLLKEIGKDKENIERVKNFLASSNLEFKFSLHRKSRTAREAASHMQVNLEEIVKSLVFLGDENGYVILIQGDRKIDEEKLRKTLGVDTLKLANPSEVKELTGYRVGSVSPFDLDLEVIMDRPILDLDKARPAAGSTCLGVEINPKDLKKISNAKVKRVS